MSANQPTVTPWRREADKEANDCARAIVSLVEKQTGKELHLEDCMKITKCVRVAIETCARRDPHAAPEATTLRLLERISSLLNEGHQAHMLAKQNYAAEFKDASELIRAHLAAHPKPSAMQQSAKQEGTQ